MGSDHDHSQQIVKGKRTKRQRPSSPFGLAAVLTDSSSSGDDESTEEEEDMANCLIMLAQGDRPNQITQPEETNIADKVQRFTSNNNNNKAAGMYVYECKTCNRSFQSFQALGGHRASHKKPKATQLESSEKKSSSTSCTVLAAVVTIKDDFNSESPLKGNKIHECSICGSEFTSGQALGGHMRRHRAANTSNSQVTTIQSSIIGDVKPATTTRSILPLDLNLPAPEDDHHIRFGNTQQSSSLVFSASALVDCHY